jgi:hypothetical protein
LVTQLESAVSIDSKNVSLHRVNNIVNAEKSLTNSTGKQCITEECISPAHHLALQSLRSSALARKTNTTTKFSRNCRNLFADLMFDDEQQKKQEDEKKEKVDSFDDKFSNQGSKKVNLKENKVKLPKLVTEEEGTKNLQKQLNEGVDNNTEKKFTDEENVKTYMAKNLTQFNNESVNDKEGASCKITDELKELKQKEPGEGELIARGPIRNFIAK